MHVKNINHNKKELKIQINKLECSYALYTYNPNQVNQQQVWACHDCTHVQTQTQTHTDVR